jgi:NCS1 family nucleobase:cation symporter-1
VSGISTDWGIVICAVGSLLITVFGYDMIHAVNRWAAVVFGGAMLLAVIIIAARGVPGDFFTAGSFSWGGFLSAVATTGILWQIAYAPYVSDYSRYMPAKESVRSTFWFSYWGVVLGTVLPMIVGVIVGLASKNSDQIAALHGLAAGAGWLIMLIFALGIIDTNSINLYGGMLCSITVGQTFRSSWLPRAATRAVVSVVIVGVSLIFALAYQSTFLTSYVNFILFLLYVLIPWTAINLVDFYLIRHGNYDVGAFFDPSGGPYGRVIWSTLVVYLIGVGVQIPFVNTTLYEGPAARALNGADISWLVGLAVTIPLYYFVARARVRHEVPAAAAAGRARA